MQIFLPYKDFRESLNCLDNKRLGKQRVEAYQIISAITNRKKLDGTPYKGWVNHPCTIMWKKYLNALREYHNLAISIWIERGFNNTMEIEKISDKIQYPDWLGFEKFHSSHRSNLLKKDFSHYSKFGWTESNDKHYLWHTIDGKWYEHNPSTKEKLFI